MSEPSDIVEIAIRARALRAVRGAGIPIRRWTAAAS